MEDPPLLKNGRGMPTTGINPITMLIFTNKLNLTDKLTFTI